MLKNVGLSADLQSRLDELRASRQRLVHAQDLERRRLERDLHDVANKHLVALKVKLGLAEMLLSRDPVKAARPWSSSRGTPTRPWDLARSGTRDLPAAARRQGPGGGAEIAGTQVTVPFTVTPKGLVDIRRHRIGSRPLHVEALRTCRNTPLRQQSECACGRTAATFMSTSSMMPSAST